MRFVIYKEEFHDGSRTTELPAAIFATEDEATARREFLSFFAREVDGLRKQFPDVTEEYAADALVATADGSRRMMRVGLLDELAKRR